MKIPNNITTGEMSAILRAKATCKKFTKEEKEILQNAARMIEYLEKQQDALEDAVKTLLVENNNMTKAKREFGKAMENALTKQLRCHCLTE